MMYAQPPHRFLGSIPCQYLVAKPAASEWHMAPALRVLVRVSPPSPSLHVMSLPYLLLAGSAIQ